MRVYRWLLLLVLILLVGGVIRASEPRPVPAVPVPVPAGCVEPGCAPLAQTVCLPTVEKTTKTRTIYSMRRETVCLTYHARCASCGECGRPREVRKLVKRMVKEEVCSPACKPQKIAVDCAK